MSQLKYQFVFSLMLAVLIGCGRIAMTKEQLMPTSLPGTPQTEVPVISPARPTETVSYSLAPLTNSAIAACPVTHPNGSKPPRARPSPNYYGNGALWVAFWTENKILIEPKRVGRDGWIAMKIGWYRGVHGHLSVEGRRLDALAPSAHGHYDPRGYGDIGFQSGSMSFPSEGCWELTGRVGEASLTFVTLVVKVPFEILRPNWFPEGLILTQKRSDVSALPKSLRIVYGHLNEDESEVRFETTQGSFENRDLYPESARQSVGVNGQPGVCVQGAWNEQHQWREDADAGVLEWSANDLSYRIRHKGLGLRCEDLLRVAKPT